MPYFTEREVELYQGAVSKRQTKFLKYSLLLVIALKHKKRKTIKTKIQAVGYEERTAMFFFLSVPVDCGFLLHTF